MTSPQGHPLTITEIDKPSSSPEDDASDITPTDTRNVRRSQRAVAEKVIKIRFQPQDRSNDPIDPSLIHIQLIREVQKALGSDVEVYDNKGNKVPTIDPLRWTRAHHSNAFDLHAVNGTKPSRYQMTKNHTGREQTVIIVHRIRTSWTLSDIKMLPEVNKLLRDHDVYLSEHRWKETIWNTTQLGFIVGLDPQFYDPEQAAERLAQDIKKHIIGKPKIPHFRMAFCTPVAKINDKGNTSVRTKAYAIETEKVNSMEMLSLLKKVYRETGEFVPFQMRSKYPEAFIRAIKAQTQTIATNRTIVLNNIGTDAILYLSHWIENVEGVKDIVPYRTVETDGKFRILVKTQDFHRVRNTLIEHLPHWFSDYVASDAQPQPGRFPGDPEVAPLFSDVLSSGNNSYMAKSVNTMMSYNEKDFTECSESQPPIHTNPRNSSSHRQRPKSPTSSNFTTWADRITQKTSHIETTAATQNSDGETSVSTSGRTDVDSIKAHLEQRNAEVEALKQELHELKSERAQFKAELESQVKEKINEAIQSQMEKISSTSMSNNQFETLLALQNKQFQEFSMQILLMIQAQHTIGAQCGNLATVTTGKRSAGTNGETSSLTDSGYDPKEERKRVDNKLTPRKLPFTMSEQSLESPESPTPYHGTPISEVGSLSQETITQMMEVDSLINTTMQADKSQGTHAETVQSEERHERVESSVTKSNHSKRYLNADQFATPTNKDV